MPFHICPHCAMEFFRNLGPFAATILPAIGYKLRLRRSR